MAERIITQPGVEPVTLDQAKAQLRLEVEDDDAFVQACIYAARKHAEGYCNRAFVTQTWDLVTNCFPAGELELPRGVLASVTSVNYYDTAGVDTLLDPADYSVDTSSELGPGYVRPLPDGSWPSTQVRWDAVRVRYVVGWAQRSVPEPIKQAILLLVSQMYEHRTPEITGTIISRVAFSFEALLSQYRLYYL